MHESHTALVSALMKHGKDVIDDLNASSANLLHATVGIATEAGELLDIGKRVAIYKKPLGYEVRAHLVEELGDIEFYLEALRQEANITREECLEHNIAKLSVRYGEKYGNDKANARADKQ